MVKLVFCLTRLPHLTREEFQRYWRERHGPLVRESAKALGIRRYVQVHTLDTPVNEALRRGRGGPEVYDGVAELWFDSLDALTAAGATPEGRATGRRLVEDERTFIDLARSPVMIAEERADDHLPVDSSARTLSGASALARCADGREEACMAIVEGKKAPDFTLADAAGKKVSLNDFKGKDVVVYFYPKDDTPGCTKEACGFRDLNKELQKAGVVVLGVSADSGESHTKFAQKYRLPFTLLSDPDRKVMTAWGAYGDKMMYGKKTKGVIRSTVWIGPDGVVRKHWKKVADAAKHPEQVWTAVRGGDA